jgi:hypothetical protein
MASHLPVELTKIGFSDCGENVCLIWICGQILYKIVYGKSKRDIVKEGKRKTEKPQKGRKTK